MVPDDGYVVWNDEFRPLGDGDSVVVVDHDGNVVLPPSGDLGFAIRNLVRQYRGAPRPWPRQMRWLRQQSRRRGDGWLRLLDELVDRRIVEPASGSDYFSGDGFHALARRPGAEDLVFVYRGNWSDGVDGVEPLEFSRACGLDRCHLVALRDEGETFYTRLTDELATFEAFVEWQRSVVRQLAPRRVYCIGTSMGGYAALLSGHYLEAHTVFALSPVDYRRHGLEPGRAHRGPEQVLAAHNGVTRYRVWYGTHHDEDARFAAELGALPGVDLVALETGTHLTGKYLHDRGELPRLTIADSADDGRALAIHDRATRALDPREVERVLVEHINSTIVLNHGSGLRPDTHLFELGILDSFTFVALLAFVHDRFGVVLDVAASGAALDTVEAIAAAIARPPDPM